MMRYSVIGFVVALAALAGCRGEIKTDLDVSTLNAAAAGQIFLVPARVGFDMGSLETCETYKIALMATLDGAFGDSQVLGCRRDGGTVMAEYRIALPVTADHMLGRPLFVWVSQDKGQTVVALQRDQLRLADQRWLVNPDLRPVLEKPFEVEILARLHNDTGATLAVSVPAAVVNGQQLTAPAVINLARGRTLTVMPQNPPDMSLARASVLLFWWPTT